MFVCRSTDFDINQEILGNNYVTMRQHIKVPTASILPNVIVLLRGEWRKKQLRPENG